MENPPLPQVLNVNYFHLTFLPRKKKTWHLIFILNLSNFIFQRLDSILLLSAKLNFQGLCLPRRHLECLYTSSAAAPMHCNYSSLLECDNYGGEGAQKWWWGRFK